jgi:hypothetical protein
MGLLREVVAYEGVVRLVDIIASAMGIVVAIWFVVRWSPSVSRD